MSCLVRAIFNEGGKVSVAAVDVPRGVRRYWEGADETEWRGVGFHNELAELRLTLETSGISSHGLLEKFLFTQVSGEVSTKGYMDPEAVLLVASWKSDRSLPCIAMNERIPGMLATSTKEAFRDGLSTKERMARLRSIHGVGVGVASALLTVFRPDEYSVADWRALEALRGHGESAGSVPFDSHNDDWWYRNYDLYIDGCVAIARRENVSLRNLDRYLWRWSRDRGAN